MPAMLSIGFHVFSSWVILQVTFFEDCNGLKCWRCDGKNSLEECHAQFGQMQTCNPGDVCQNDFRLANGKPVIIKNCKQKTACETEVRQNKDKNQCGSKLFGKNMACRCCCSTTGCNRLESGCIPPPPPCKRRRLLNGRILCNGVEIKFGTKCQFLCNPGYELQGVRGSTCRRRRGKKRGFWSPAKLPKCIRTITRCNPPRGDILNGKMVCSNTKEFQRFSQFNYEGSVCRYTCDLNYCLAGKAVTRCKGNGEWSNEEPVCRQGTCANIAPDDNRINDCTDGFKFGTNCDFTCKEGYRLDGKSNSECLPSCTTPRGFWSEGLPRCREIRCTKARNPANGRVKCTDGNRLGSLCTYTCNYGYDLDKTVKDFLTSTCEYVGESKVSADWSRKPPPTCTRIRCVPPRGDPNNGISSCTDKNWLGSECSVSCDDGYTFDYSSDMVTRCEEDGNGDKFGQWSEAAMDCKAIECDLKDIMLPNSNIVCSNGDLKGSECSITCRDGFALRGVIDTDTITTRCGDAFFGSERYRGEWSAINATCEEIKCNELGVISNGVKSCSDDGERVPLGTECSFTCNRGYKMVGHQQTWCRDLKNDRDEHGEWTSPPPRCVLNPCPEPVYDRKTVEKTCWHPDGEEAGDNRLDTRCRYRCINEGFYMVSPSSNKLVLSGESVAACLSTQLWSKQPPECKEKVCVPPLRALTNGYPPICTNGYTYGSTCEFKCKDKYALTVAEPLKCIDDGDNDQYGKWDKEIPECKRSHCDEFGVVKHGWLNCTDGTRIGSVCDLSCKERYTVKFYEETECLKTIEWSKRRFFCCVRCEFNNRIKVLAVYDASAFGSKLDWEYMVDFTESYLALMVGNGFDVEFSSVLYGRDVYQRSVYPMRKLHNRESVSAVGDHLEYMCSGSCLRERAGNTGRALRYIDTTVFPEIDDEREHFVIIRTTGRSTDKMEEIAQKLRNRNINILVIGIKARRDSESALLQLAGRERNYMTVQRPRDLKDVPAKIFEISKDTGCTAASKSKPCP